MDYEYNDDADDNEVDYFSDVIKEYAFTDGDVQTAFALLYARGELVSEHDELNSSIRDKDISEARVTRICKSEYCHVFRLHFLNGEKYILRFHPEQSFDSQIEIMSVVAARGVEVPKNYLSHSDGFGVGRHNYCVLLQQHIDGIDFDTATKRGLVGPSGKETILAAMGSRLRTIHSIKQVSGIEKTNEHKHFFTQALERLDHDRSLILDEGICTKEDFEEVYLKIDSMKSVAQILSSESYGLVHFDFHPRHILIDASDLQPRIAAILNWSEATFSNTYFDFALWDFWCGEDFLVDSVMESYGMEAFTSSESKVNVELTTIAALVKELCDYAHVPDFKATQLGLWQRLIHEVREATY